MCCVAETIFKSLETFEGALKDEKTCTFISELAEGFKNIKKKFFPTVGHVIHVNAQQF
jgi:hypothetical protein